MILRKNECCSNQSKLVFCPTEPKLLLSEAVFSLFETVFIFLIICCSMGLIARHSGSFLSKLLFSGNDKSSFYLQVSVFIDSPAWKTVNSWFDWDFSFDLKLDKIQSSLKMKWKDCLSWISKYVFWCFSFAWVPGFFAELKKLIIWFSIKSYQGCKNIVNIWDKFVSEDIKIIGFNKLGQTWAF